MPEVTESEKKTEVVEKNKVSDSKIVEESKETKVESSGTWKILSHMTTQ